MNWDAIGAIGEIVGAFAVVISLSYLASQIKVQNREARISSVHDITEAFRNSIRELTDRQKAETYSQGLADFDSLDEPGRIQFLSIVQGHFRVWEEAHFQHTEDRLDEKTWDAMRIQYEMIFQSNGAKRVWELRRQTYSREFQVYVDGVEATDEYRFQ